MKSRELQKILNTCPRSKQKLAIFIQESAVYSLRGNLLLVWLLLILISN
jgi:hypothetical protein